MSRRTSRSGITKPSIDNSKIQSSDMEISQSIASVIQSSNSASSNDDALKLVIVCVGLPARGKSYITKKLQRYLNWMQYNTKIFNVGNTRRQLNVYEPSKYPVQGPTIDHSTPMQTPNPSTSNIIPDFNDNKNNNNSNSNNNDPLHGHDANLFDHNNKKNFQLREQWAKETLNQLLDFLLSDDGNVGIFDATNTTHARRKWIVETINKRTKGLVKILFLESICTDTELIEKNIRLKLSGPDYKKMDPEKALQDFRNRLINYEKVYQTINESEEFENEKYDIQYVKIINAGKKVISFNISGYLSSQCVFFLLNFNLADRQIWLTANGESVFNVQNKLGGDSDLTRNGIQFAKALPKFIAKKQQEFKLKHYSKDFVNDTSSFKTDRRSSMSSNYSNTTTTSTGSTNNNNSNNINIPPSAYSSSSNSKNFNIWTSTLNRTIETAHYFPRDDFCFKSFKILNDLGCGSYDSMSEDDFRYLHPTDYMESLQNKLSFRYPGLGGESYLDVISRLRPIIIELERLQDHVLIISHRVIIRVLLCYFMNLNKEMLTELDVQHNYVYCIEPKPYGLDLKIWHYDQVTDMFIEVDVAEIMKRKRKRGSVVLDDVERLRRLLLRHNLNYDLNDNLSIGGRSVSDNEFNYNTDTDTESETDSYTHGEPTRNNSMDSNKVQSPKNLCERSESQAYEFCRNSSTDLRALNSNNSNNSNKENDTHSQSLKNSVSGASIMSLNSSPSIASLTSLAGLSNSNMTNLPNIRKNLKGSSSDLRAQAVQGNIHSLTNFQMNNPNTELLTPAITLSRKNSLKHIKKPSIDWDIFDYNVETDDTSHPTVHSPLTNRVTSISSDSGSNIKSGNNSNPNSNTSLNFHTKIHRINSASSGASSNSEQSAVIDAEVDLILGNPSLMAKLKERMKAENIKL